MSIDKSPEQDIRTQALSYTPFGISEGQIQMILPPDVYPDELHPRDAREFGTVLRVARLSIVRSSSHAVSDIERLPILDEIDRLQAIFPAPPTPLERDIRLIKSVVSNLGVSVLHRLLS